MNISQVKYTYIYIWIQFLVSVPWEFTFNPFFRVSPVPSGPPCSGGWGYHREVTWRNGSGGGSWLVCELIKLLKILFDAIFAISILIFVVHCFVCHSWCYIILSNIVMISSSGQLVVVIYVVEYSRFAEWKDDSNYRPVNSHILFGNMGFSIENTATKKKTKR